MPRTLLLAALLITPSPALAQAATPPAEPAQQLVERLIRSMYGPNADVQVTYGAIPAALPIQLDPRLNVTASLRTSGNNGRYVQHRILASTSLKPEDALTALARSLEASGWKARPSYAPLLGFASPQTIRNTGFYREGTTSFALNAGITQRGSVTELDVNVDVVIASFKKAPTSVPRSSLPLLRVFPGATIKGTYPATSPSGALSSAHVQTTRPAAEVFNFYSAQLGAAGWKARTDTTDGPLRVVTYSLKDLNGREALGTLGLRPWEGEGGGYVLTVSVQGFKPW